MNKFFSTFILVTALIVMLMPSAAFSKDTYVMEVSNALEKEGITVAKTKWNFGDSEPVVVYDRRDGEIVVYKGYNPYYASNNSLMVYGIIEADSESETYMLMRFDANTYIWE